MGLGHYLFGFSGRINRAKQWAVLLVSAVHVALVCVVFVYTIGLQAIVALAQEQTTLSAVVATPQAHTFGIVFCVLYLIGLYIGLAVATKRLHDRNRSAWWLIVFFLLPAVLQIPTIMAMPEMFANIGAAMHAAQNNLPPPPPPVQSPLALIARGAATIIGLWAFVELYILRGTAGDNRFGPDPLAGR
ncbi:MAG: DUF805 domain-containing protein [Rhizomicrobium sp.]